MRILVTSDWHVDAVTAGVERLPELAEYVSALEDAIHEHGVELVLNLGDCWDPGSLQDPRWARFFYESQVHLASAVLSRMPRDPGLDYHLSQAFHRAGVLCIPGNHDVLDTETPTSTLSPLRAARAPHVLVLEEPTAYRVGDLTVLALPYVSRAYERTDAYNRALGDALEAAERAAANSPVVVIGHLSFDNMHPGSESEDMARGRDVMFPVAAVEEVGPLLVLNGHYHQRQTIRRGKLDIEIPGAPIRFTFGERADGPRGFLILEV